MKHIRYAELYWAVAIACLLVLTAWGNALGMFIVSTLFLLIGLLLWGRQFSWRGTLVAVGAIVVAALVSVFLQGI